MKLDAASASGSKKVKEDTAVTRSEDSHLASLDQIIDEILDRLRTGESPDLEDYLQRYPENASEIRDVFPALVMAEQIKQQSMAGNGNQKLPPPLRNTENDLLLGMLALQCGLINREQFLESFAKWNRDRSQSYRSVLLSENWIRPEAMDLLEILASKQPSSSMSRSEGLAAGPEVGDFTIDLGGQPKQPLSKPLASTIAPETLSHKRSEMIGNYKLLQKIAEGGMGAVWMAEQQRPVIRRVALKLIKAGHDTEQIVARFEAERQALAMMEHQNIAKMLDGGQTETGLPYFVMELVQGIPITKYCDQNKLSLEERLKLFIPVCHAVQHAHQKGIIHRDLKPSNILVTLFDGKPVPKVIDFGLAKATQMQSRLTDKTMFTEFGQVVGTLQYMSPEQAEMNSMDIDTRTDVYALGVLLFELLTGSTPIDKGTFENLAIFKVLEAIRTKEPPRPSTRLSTCGDAITDISDQRRISPDKLRGILKGDLDWVVMKALEKDRTRRYETANDFAQDVTRYLNSEPLLARPPSKVYILQKFVRKNKTAVVTASFMMLLLILGFVGTAIGMARAIAERNRANEASIKSTEAAKQEMEQRKIAESNLERALHAETEEKTRSEQLFARGNELEKISKFQQAQLSEINSAKMGKKLRTALQSSYAKELLDEKLDESETKRLLDAFELACLKVNFTDLANKALDESIFEPAMKAIETQYTGQPLFQAKMFATISFSLRSIGLLDSAEEPAKRAYTLRVEHLGAMNRETLEAKHEYACLVADQGKISESLALFETVMRECRDSLGEDDELTLVAVGTFAGGLDDAGRFDEAEPLYRKNLADRQRLLAFDDRGILASMNDLAICLKKQMKLEEAAQLSQKELKLRETLRGPHHEETYTSMLNLASILYEKGQIQESLNLDQKAVEGLRDLLGNEHPTTLSAINNLANSYQLAQKYEFAEPLYQEAIEVGGRLNGEAHPSTIRAMNNLAMLLGLTGRHDESIKLHLKAVEQCRKTYGSAHPNTVEYLGNLANEYLAVEKDQEALPWVREYYEKTGSLQAGIGLAETLFKLGQNEEARELSSKLKTMLDTTLANDPRNRANKLTELAWAYYQGNELDLMKPLLIEAKPLHLETGNENSLMGLDNEHLLKELEKQENAPME